MIDLDLLKLQAVKTGLGIKYLAKEERISLLLQQLHELFPKESLVLKGGTALNRGYLFATKKGRFSEDIDIDYQKHQGLNGKIQDISEIMKTIEDFTIGKPRLLHRTLRFDCQYVNQLTEKDRVQIEFYLSEKKEARPPKEILLQSQYLPVSATLFSVYDFEELIAQKLVSLYRRMEGKDIYDLFYGLEVHVDLQQVFTSLSTLFHHYHITTEQNKFFYDLVQRLQNAETNARYIGNATNHFIPKSLRPNWMVFIRGLQDKINQRFL